LDYSFERIEAGYALVPLKLHLRSIGEDFQVVTGIYVDGVNVVARSCNLTGGFTTHSLFPVVLTHDQHLIVKANGDMRPKTITGFVDGMYMPLKEAVAYVESPRAWEERSRANSDSRLGVGWLKSEAKRIWKVWEDKRIVSLSEDDLNNYPIRTELSQAIIDLIKISAFPIRVMLELLSKGLEGMNGTSSTLKGPTQGFIVQFEKTKVAKGMSVNIRYQSLVSFRPMCLEIPRAIRKYFQIIDIKVGKNSQLLSAVPIPATVFSKEDGTPVLLKMDVTKPGYDIVLSVTNIDSSDREFEATMFGQIEERHQ
jgi:hypothetical protein